MTAVFEELARVSFDLVSINRIVKNAGISRGSFYQYFPDKDDMLEFVMSSYLIALHDKARKVLRQSGGDIFAVLRRMLSFTIEYGIAEVNRDFCRNIFLHISRGDMNALKPLRIDAQRYIQEFIAYADLSSFRDRSDQALTLAADMLGALLRGAVVRAFMDIDSAKEVQEDFDRILEFAKYGLLAGKDSNG